MNINLSIDIPKEYNDMSQGELAQLSVNIKKLVDELNYALKQLDESNMSDEFLSKIKSSRENLNDAGDALDRLEEINGNIQSLQARCGANENAIQALQASAGKIISFQTTSANGPWYVYDSSIKADSIIQVIPDIADAYTYNYFGMYIDYVYTGTVRFICMNTAPAYNLSFSGKMIIR